LILRYLSVNVPKKKRRDILCELPVYDISFDSKWLRFLANEYVDFAFQPVLFTK